MNLLISFTPVPLKHRSVHTRYAPKVRIFDLLVALRTSVLGVQLKRGRFPQEDHNVGLDQESWYIQWIIWHSMSEKRLWITNDLTIFKNAFDQKGQHRSGQISYPGGGEDRHSHPTSGPIWRSGHNLTQEKHHKKAIPKLSFAQFAVILLYSPEVAPSSGSETLGASLDEMGFFPPQLDVSTRTADV